MNTRFSASLSVHRVTSSDISIEAKHHGGTQWLTVNLGEELSIDIFCYDDNFEAMCAKFGISNIKEIA